MMKPCYFQVISHFAAVLRSELLTLGLSNLMMYT